jgi:hypothetical protein
VRYDSTAFTRQGDGRRAQRVWATSSGLEDDTASICSGFEPSRQRGLLDSLDDCSQHGEVYATNELGVLPGQRVEGVVGQHDRAAGAAWCVPALTQRFVGAVEKSFSACLRTSGCSRLISDGATRVGGRRLQGVVNGGCRPRSRQWHWPVAGRRGRIGVQATSLTAAGWIAGTAWWDGRRRGLDVR